ncbi:hypothetical protein LCGC14_3086060 [marine sediment metagenome]|uniref:Uncharacterized protein n=1 Tax=marine sediment metagenome TaxID=412755 RepID=A0A0F8X0G1_9ZZZZ
MAAITDVLGCTFDGAAFCPAHCPDKDRCEDEHGAIFADSEWDCEPSCDRCSELIEVRVRLPEGLTTMTPSPWEIEGRNIVKATDILVDTPSPEALDKIVQTFGGNLVGGPEHFRRVEGHYVVRCFGDPGFMEATLTHQGYATVIRRLEELL